MKKTITIILITLLLTLSLVSADYNAVIDDEQYPGEATVSYKEMGDIEFFFKSILNQFQPLTVIVSPNNPTAGDRISVEWFGGAECQNSVPIEDIKIIIQKGGQSDFFAIYDVPDTSFYGSSGFSGQISVDFQNSFPEGSYVARFLVYSGDGAICYSDNKFFTVDEGTCDESDYCSDWAKESSVTGGDLMSRTCYDISSAPECRKTSDKETKIVCDSGYTLIGGACQANQEDTPPPATNECDSVSSASEFCACNPTSQICTTGPVVDEPIDESDDGKVEEWYEEGNNEYYLIGGAFLLIIILLQARGNRRK